MLLYLVLYCMGVYCIALSLIVMYCILAEFAAISSHGRKKCLVSILFRDFVVLYNYITLYCIVLRCIVLKFTVFIIL